MTERIRARRTDNRHRGRALARAALTIGLIVIMVAPPAAQVLQAAATPPGETIAGAAETITLLVGRSTVLRTERPIVRIALPAPTVADALLTSSHEVLIHGKAPGTISLLVWGDTGQINAYNVAVRRDLGDLEARIQQLFPGEPISISSNGDAVVLSGVVTSKYVVDKAASLAAGYVENASNVVNLLRQEEGVASNQVLLRVRFAEVSRTALQELGATFFTGIPGHKNWLGRVTTQQFPAPEFDAEKGVVFSDFLNILAFNMQEQIGAVIKALQTRGLFQSLAEPNLVTQNGREASFLAGGEYPYPVLQGSGLNAAVTIMFKEFGVRLRFTPTVVGNDLIHLRVAPEVSALDFSNAVTLEGFRIPALSTRRTETEVELRDGQTFAIAGLIDRTVTETLSKVPGIGDIPILGYLFRSRAFRKDATELVVMITPHILRRDSTGVTSELPAPVEPFIGPAPERLPVPPPAFSAPARPPAAGEPPAGDATRPATAAAPAPVSALPDTSERAQRQAARNRDKARAEGAKRAREEARRHAEDATRQREAEERDRQRVERGREAEARRAREAAEAEAARARTAAKAEAERQVRERRVAERQARIDAEAARIRAAEEAKAAERRRKTEEKAARERAAREANAAKLAARIERLRLEAERRDAEERRKAEEALERKRAKRRTALERLLPPPPAQRPAQGSQQ